VGWLYKTYKNLHIPPVKERRNALVFISDLCYNTLIHFDIIAYYQFANKTSFWTNYCFTDANYNNPSAKVLHTPTLPTLDGNSSVPLFLCRTADDREPPTCGKSLTLFFIKQNQMPMTCAASRLSAGRNRSWLLSPIQTK
jgi:hypothetical protein